MQKERWGYKCSWHNAGDRSKWFRLCFAEGKGTLNLPYVCAVADVGSARITPCFSLFLLPWQNVVGVMAGLLGTLIAAKSGQGCQEYREIRIQRISFQCYSFSSWADITYCIAVAVRSYHSVGSNCSIFWMRKPLFSFCKRMPVSPYSWHAPMLTTLSRVLPKAHEINNGGGLERFSNLLTFMISSFI